MQQGNDQDGTNSAHAPSGAAPDASILVVEDGAPLLRLLKFLLERQGYTLFTASDGNDVLPLMHRHRPGLVILDIMLPNRDGISLLGAIRADGVLSETPVVVLSAKAQDIDIACGISVGADLYITKPFRPELLLETVTGFLPRLPSTRLPA